MRNPTVRIQVDLEGAVDRAIVAQPVRTTLRAEFAGRGSSDQAAPPKADVKAVVAEMRGLLV